MHKTFNFFFRNPIALVLIFTFAIYLYSFFIVGKQTIFADGVGYFSYPYELFTNGNIFYESEASSKTFGLRQIDNGNYLNKYPIGTGILLAPAYILGNIYNVTTNQKTINIYSDGFQFFVGIIGIMYFYFGLKFLEKILKRFFNNKTVFYTIIVTALATNIMAYASTDASFSHIYSFFTINAFVLTLLRWNENPKLSNTILLGATLGAAALIRNSNITLLFFLIGYIVLNNKNYLNKVLLSKLGLIFLVSVCTMIPQFIYWNEIAGHLILYSYGSESFNVFSPQIWSILLGAERGLIYWHPIIIFGFIGMLQIKKNKEIIVPIILFLILNTYIISSWWYTNYGIGFGHRAFTDLLGIIAILVAYGIDYMTTNKKVLNKVFLVSIILLIAVNIINLIEYINHRNFFSRI